MGLDLGITKVTVVFLLVFVVGAFLFVCFVWFLGGKGKRGRGTGTRVVSVLHIFIQIDHFGCGASLPVVNTFHLFFMICLKSCLEL